MKYILGLLIPIVFFISCEKDADSPVEDINVEGYWSVLDPTYTSNSTVDLYYLFKGKTAYYKFSFLKTHDFTDLSSQPRSDSLIAMYKVYGNELLLSNTVVGVPSSILLSQGDNTMTFTRTTVTVRNVLDGKVEASRTDTIQYTRVTDAAKVAYFDNYLKKWHP